MTMHWIATGTGNGSSPAIDFQNIPQTFSHLRLHVYARSAYAGTTGSLGLYFNNDTTSGTYFIHNVYGDGSTVYQAGTVNNQFTTYNVRPSGSTALSNTFGCFIYDFLDYTAAKNKNIQCIGGLDNNTTTGVNTVGTISGTWNSTSAINRLTLTTETAWASGTRMDLYGITSNPIATGA